jgi:hypothetical protein
MKSFEYKVLHERLGGIFKKESIPKDLLSTLNAEGSEGWRLASSFVSTKLGDSQAVTLIFIREKG